jgi:hypothetical protein
MHENGCRTAVLHCPLGARATRFTRIEFTQLPVISLKTPLKQVILVQKNIEVIL